MSGEALWKWIVITIAVAYVAIPVVHIICMIVADELGKRSGNL